MLALKIRPLSPTDRTRWETLARGYKTFYQIPLPAHDYDQAWARLMQASDLFGLGAFWPLKSIASWR